MKLAIITVIIVSLTTSLSIQAKSSDRQSARKSSNSNATKTHKPRQHRRETAAPRVPRQQAQKRPQRQLNSTPPIRGNRYGNVNANSQKPTYDKGRGFGSPKQSISNHKRLEQNNAYRGDPNGNKNSYNRNSFKENSPQRSSGITDRNRKIVTPSQSRNNNITRSPDSRERRVTESRVRPENRANTNQRVTTREIPRYQNNRDTLRPSDRGNSTKRIRSTNRLPESMPIRRHADKASKRYSNGRRVSEYRSNKRDDYRYKQHRWLINKQKHRRHHASMPRQLERYRNNHYRGKHNYGNWHRGHNHYHYDYRYRYLYNPYQWYDDYYYHSYFNWRWDNHNYWQMSGYYNYYMDPYYCPDDFGQFITTLAVGALILSW